MYESTIEIVYGAMKSEIEGAVYKAIQDVGIVVNKDELIRALKHDRQQYETGFKDGMKNALLKIAADANAKEVEICLLHHMKWQDDGCCLDCVECVKRHLEG